MWYRPGLQGAHEKSHKISSKTYHFLPKFWSEEFSYICYTIFINLAEMKGKSPWCPFVTYHMYVDPDQAAPSGAVWSESTLFAIPSAPLEPVTL